MSIILRPYQIDIVNQARTLMQNGHKSILIQSPTGSGKTALTAHMLKTAVSKNMPSWFIVHRRELVKQSMRAFDKIGLYHGVIANNFIEDYQPLSQICSIQTLVNRFGRLKQPQLIVWDECHHVAAKGWAKIFEVFPSAFHIGLTATPERLDGKGLGQYFKTMVNGPSVEWLIDNGYLSKYRLFAPSSPNMVGIHTKMGDFVKSELTDLIDRPTITGDAIKHYIKYASGKRAVVFCVSVEHSKHVCDQFNSAGIKAEHVDGETESEIRDAAIKRFDSGETRVLCNVELFGEGFDLPSLEVAILLRPTQSLGLYLQQVGRCLRPSPGKECAIILDHSGNCERHGLPSEDRQWTLEGRGFTNNSNAKRGSVRICPACYAAQQPGCALCSFCNFKFVVQSREITYKEDELVEVDTAIKSKPTPKRIEQGKAQTEQDLIDIGIVRGYKRPHLWARHIMMARARKRGGS